MRRYFTVKRSSTAQEPFSEKALARSETDPGTFSSENEEATENASTTALLSPTAPLTPPTLKVKRVDYYYSKWSKSWKYKNMGEKVTPETLAAGVTTGNDPWQTFCFVVVRTFPQAQQPGEVAEPTFSIHIKSPYLLEACKTVIQKIPGISWNDVPLVLDPHLLLTFLPLFEEYHAKLAKKSDRTQEETYTMSSVAVLTEYLHRDYKATLASVARLTSHGEINFKHLFAILIPRSILVTKCAVTGETRAVQLITANKIKNPMGRDFYELLCESIDVDDDPATSSPTGVDAELRKAGIGPSFGRVSNRVLVPAFPGTVKIRELDCYPIKYYPNEAELREALIARGRKWVSYKGVHHIQYKANAALRVDVGGCKRIIKHHVDSRVMIDRANFRRINPNYEMPKVKRESQDMSHVPPPSAHPGLRRGGRNNNTNRYGVPTLSVQANLTQKSAEDELTEEELMLTSPVVYGFSLADKAWLEYSVEHVQEITWNDEAFANLVLPTGRKTLLQSLVEAHNADLGFDDFIKGKGHGLVINLFGPPGVGKTLSAEATSEHVRSPLYVIGGGDLGTNATELDATLQRVFDIATSWKAIVLIDEADVFLEQRSLHDLERNAMVAIFLRHLEYYRGILFLTTNRVKTFDEAFLSRIHVALHFQELPHAAKAQVWRAFLKKVGVEIGSTDDGSGVTAAELDKLSERQINGRQIKNATRTAVSLAVGRGEKLRYSHLVQTLDAMEEFTTEFKAMTLPA